RRGSPLPCVRDQHARADLLEPRDSLGGHLLAARPDDHDGRIDAAERFAEGFTADQSRHHDQERERRYRPGPKAPHHDTPEAKSSGIILASCAAGTARSLAAALARKTRTTSRR